MNITFMIGNGFDLRVGMKTRFSDMYEGYIEQPHTSESIQKFKDMLKEDAPEYKTWGDFEMAMAQKAKEFDSEDAFVECLRDFKVYMAKYLEREQQGFLERLFGNAQIRTSCSSELSNSIEMFYLDLSPNVQNEFKRLGAQKNPNYNYISFNYTEVFDVLLRPYDDLMPDEGVIHIHGNLDADVVLGADNLGQVKDLPYSTTRKIERAFIKPEFNKRYDINRMRNAESIIGKSDVICIYGMSLGKSDLMWVNHLKDWLMSDVNHHLVYYVYDKTEFSKLNWDAIMDEEDKRIATILGKLCEDPEEMNKIWDQIHIPVGCDIFDIESVLQYAEKRVAEEEARREELRKQLDELKQESLTLRR